MRPSPIRSAYKTTDWYELDIEKAIILDHDRGQVRIAHPELRRPLWFTPSRAGNLYWRSTGGTRQDRAFAWIIAVKGGRR